MFFCSSCLLYAPVRAPRGTLVVGVHPPPPSAVPAEAVADGKPRLFPGIQGDLAALHRGDLSGPLHGHHLPDQVVDELGDRRTERFPLHRFVVAGPSADPENLRGGGLVDPGPALRVDDLPPAGTDDPHAPRPRSPPPSAFYSPPRDKWPISA